MTDKQRLRNAALQAARRQGCICQPDVTLNGGDPVWRAQVAHEDWCPLYPTHEQLPTGVPSGPIVFVPPGWKAGDA